MKTLARLMTNAHMAITFAAVMLLFCFMATKTGASSGIEKKFFANVAVFSIQEGNTLDSYKFYLKGAGEGNTTVGTICRDDVRDFGVRIHFKMEGVEFHATVEIKPSDSLTKGETYDLDLSDLKARSVELARNEDGRVYVLNLIPHVNIIDKRPRRAYSKVFRIENWKFSHSAVITNDSQYVGRLGGGGCEMASMDIPGVGKIVFALVPFRDAKLLGVLEDGHIVITAEDGTTVEVLNVENGSPPRKLPGGPYEVWVRWSPPTSQLSREELSDLLRSAQNKTDPQKQAVFETHYAGWFLRPGRELHVRRPGCQG